VSVYAQYRPTARSAVATIPSEGRSEIKGPALARTAGRRRVLITRVSLGVVALEPSDAL
jgi:hypothetical protein